MMLGINAPKPLVKGEFAKAVRKAVRDSMIAKENIPNSRPGCCQLSIFCRE